MFSDLRQNGIVYILNKKDKLTVKTGHVASPVNPANQLYGQYSGLNQTTDLVVNVDGKTEEYKQIPLNQNVVSYDNGNTIVSDSTDVIVAEVENMIRISKSLIDPATIKYNESVITDGEDILKKISPSFAKEKARDEEIDNLNKRVSGIDSKLDKLFTILSKSETK